jgi:hypothetical protein
MAYKSHSDFSRIREYFNGGKEYKGRRCIVRDNENTRKGLYFIVNFNKPLNKLPTNLTLNVHMMIGQSMAPEKFEFKLPDRRPNFSAEVYCGITSKRIDTGKINAWKVELVNGERIVTATSKSYAWPKNM